METFLSTYMRRFHPDVEYECRESTSYNGWELTFPNHPHTRGVLKIAATPVFTGDRARVFREIAHLIDQKLADPEPWELWSAYV